MEYTIQTVKEIRDIETNELQGYLVDGTKSVPLAKGNRDYKEVLEWLESNEVELAYTDTERADYLKEKALSDVNKDYETQVQALIDGIPQSEISTWTKQESEARAYIADNTVSTPLIDNLCTARGVDKDYLVSKIIEKANAYAVAIGTLIGLRQKAEDELGDI